MKTLKLGRLAKLQAVKDNIFRYIKKLAWVNRPFWHGQVIIVKILNFMTILFQILSFFRSLTPLLYIFFSQFRSCSYFFLKKNCESKMADQRWRTFGILWGRFDVLWRRNWHVILTKVNKFGCFAHQVEVHCFSAFKITSVESRQGRQPLSLLSPSRNRVKLSAAWNSRYQTQEYKTTRILVKKILFGLKQIITTEMELRKKDTKFK